MSQEKNQTKQKGRPSLGVSEFFTAENIETLISVISAAAGITTATVKAISLWMEDRKSRKIRMKYKDAEVEISGPISKEKIEEALEIFSNFYSEKISAEKVSVIIKE